MDVIKFVVRNSENLEVVDIFINGRNLIDMVKEVELPFAQSEGSPNIAGGYEGLSPNDVFLPSRHLLDQPKSLLEYDGKVSVLECVCGCEGCWPFILKITLTEDKVTWSDYEQPHRNAESASEQWKYDKLPTFVFSRNEYEAALIKPV